MKRKKYTIILIIIFIIINCLMVPNISFAKNGAIELKTNKRKVNIGDEFTISVVLIKNRTINGANALLSYDENVVKCIDTNVTQIAPFYPYFIHLNKEGRKN